MEWPKPRQAPWSSRFSLGLGWARTLAPTQSEATAPAGGGEWESVSAAEAKENALDPAHQRFSYSYDAPSNLLRSIENPGGDCTAQSAAPAPKPAQGPVPAQRPPGGLKASIATTKTTT